MVFGDDKMNGDMSMSLHAPFKTLMKIRYARGMKSGNDKNDQYW